ncbi:MAG TPA: competence protein ComEC, partial [Ramlibacter sp.]|nr:competence protein ComEC [Ramlibacter sp.]
MSIDSPSRAAWLVPALLGAVVGPALQLQQPALWPAAAYGLLLAAALGTALLLARLRALAGRRAPALLLAALAAFALCGLRATWFSADALAPQLEGR